MAVGDFWEQTFATYNAAMRGALKARRERFEADRDLALLNAYFSGQMASADWSKVPDYQTWHARMITPRKRVSNAELVARFEAMASRGFDVTIN